MKSLKISKRTHTLLKVYCAKNGLKMNVWADNLISKTLKNSSKYEKINS